MTDRPEETTPSLTQQVIAETIRQLRQQGNIDEGVIDRLKHLGEIGRLNKPKDITEVLKQKGGNDENITT